MENLDLENLSPQMQLIQHWSSFGQRGKTPDHRIGPWNWRKEPFVSPVSCPWHVAIQPHQLPLLLLGFLPRLADERLPADMIFVVGEVMTSHIFMSSSKRNDVSASEDKWFIYADGPDSEGEVRLHFHRSWTGIKVFELVIDAGLDGYGKDGQGASITSIIYENDPEEKWKDADAEEYKRVAREVCWWVLNVRLGAEDLVIEKLLGLLRVSEEESREAS
ncbi:hypothetical protein M011DRAFT_466539 [Sporormia fimetaria CBS 119925]|uniref:Uncharacterized protein n=1 Tax=Sporormia fimetaria CBS 119925 TaxID=1340428 RepID=A0A6A6VI29_9PLEO|nr:hypothetical protein M011DRAFT_466539 [Sporormia fimetaria CBS 119925]